MHLKVSYFLDVRLQRGIQTKSVYLKSVKWQSLELDAVKDDPSPFLCPFRIAKQWADGDIYNHCAFGTKQLYLEDYKADFLKC